MLVVQCRPASSKHSGSSGQKSVRDSGSSLAVEGLASFCSTADGRRRMLAVSREESLLLQLLLSMLLLLQLELQVVLLGGTERDRHIAACVQGVGGNGLK